jgi:hypothetical protein
MTFQEIPGYAALRHQKMAACLPPFQGQATGLESIMKPSFGLRFIHANLMCEDARSVGENKQALCEIIRVVDDIVWYAVLGRNGGTVSREWVQLDRFEEIFAQAA